MKNTKRLLGTVLLILSLGGCSEKTEITIEEDAQKEETSVLSVPTPASEEKEIQTADTAENQETVKETPSSEEKPKETAKTTEKKKKKQKTETAAAATHTPAPAQTPAATPAPTPEITPVPTAAPASAPDAAPEVKTASSDVPKSAKVGGVSVSLNANMADVLNKLGEPSSYDEQDSCYYSGKDKTYTYSGFEITTYPSGKTDKVASIYMKKGSISGNVQIGSFRKDVLAKHAGDKIREASTAITFVKGGRGITYYMSGDKVSAIELYLDN